jgi:predicted PurR-regulated permease PerM
MAILASSLQTLRPKSAATAVVAVGVVVALLYYGRAFFITLSVAAIIAFILEPFVALLMRFRLPRALASFFACVGALLVVYLASLAIYTQLASLYQELPVYSQKISELAGAVIQKVDEMEQSAYKLLVPRRKEELEQRLAPTPTPAARVRGRRKPVEVPVPAGPPPIQEVRILPERTPLVDYIYSHLGLVYRTVLMASFVPFLVYFMLSWRDHIYYSFLQLFEGEDRVVAGNSLKGIATMVRAFVVGNFALGLMLAGVSSLVFWLMHLPYPLLIGPMSGVLSLIPYIGLPLSMAPPLFAALATYTTMPAYLLLATVVAVMHLIALNLLYPKIVGSRVHLNPLVVTVALMLWGVIWGAAGLVLAIPVTAAIKAVCDNVSRLQPYGRFLGD